MTLNKVLKLMSLMIISLITILYSLPNIIDTSHISILPQHKINLGLDIKGGASLLLEINYDEYLAAYTKQRADIIGAKMRAHGIALQIRNTTLNKIIMDYDPNTSTDIKTIVRLIKESLQYECDVQRTGEAISITFHYDSHGQVLASIMEQTIKIIRRRVDETGTKEIDIQRQGDNYILLQVPGVQDTAALKRLLGSTAKLSFHEVTNVLNKFEHVIGNIILPSVENKDGERNINFALKPNPVIAGDMLLDAQVGINNTSQFSVNFKLNDQGAKLFADFTSKNHGKRLAIVLDNKVISAPIINEPILGGSGTISGNFNMQAASELALLLRSGALPASVKIAQEQIVGPSIGADAVNKAQHAAAIACLLVTLCMVLVYRLLGFIAAICMIINIFMILTVMMLFNATLTLPSIAGLILTMGMSVDANVLIFERIKEELRAGRKFKTAISLGYKAALLTIIDSNVTTIIAAALLYCFATGPVKGFAIALSIGILCSMFTSVILTRVVIEFIADRKTATSKENIFKALPF